MRLLHDSVFFYNMGTEVTVPVAYLYLNLTTVDGFVYTDKSICTAMDIFINNSRNIGDVKFLTLISEKPSVMLIKIVQLLEIRKSWNDIKTVGNNKLYVWMIEVKK